jgi:hypothetical protein
MPLKDAGLAHRSGGFATLTAIRPINDSLLLLLFWAGTVGAGDV